MDERCSICGQVADPEDDGDPPLGWSADLIEARGGTRVHWICPDCTRVHVRAIEAKLDREWW
jgi:rubredoxin